MRPNTVSPSPKLDAADWLACEAERLAVEGRFGESERMLGRLLTLQEQAIAGGELDLAETLGMRGEVRFLASDLVGAEEDFRRALAIRERCRGHRHPETASALSSLALVLWRRGEPAEAEPLLSRCLDVRRSLLGDKHPETLRTQSRLKSLWRELAGMEDDVAATQEDELEASLEFASTTVVTEWTALRDQFGALSRRLLDAARAERAVPADEIMRELADCRLAFQRLCDEACAWAEAFQVPCPPAGQLENLLGIAAFLDQIGEAVLKQDRADRPRRRTLLILEQVLRLAHTLALNFAPLTECQQRAQTLHTHVWTTGEAESEAVRPFYDLLLLAHQRRTLSDDAWSRLHQSVSVTFGKALAAAATRGHLVPSAALAPDGELPANVPDIPAVLQPQFAREVDDYTIPLAAVPLRPVPATPRVVGGPLSVASADGSAGRPGRVPASDGEVRFRTADGKLYALMPAEPVAGRKGLIPSPLKDPGTRAAT